jgi:hypothetical protein
VSEALLLSRPKLTAFLDCPRRFQLRSLKHLPWPNLPDNTQSAETMLRGQQFHLLLEQYFLGLNIPLSSIGDEAVANWFQTFKQHNPVRPNGRYLPEHRLTVPIGNHLLLGRFDLLVVGEQDGTTFAHIYDWKTGKARGEGALRQDWQTRLYLALLAEGGSALWGVRFSNGRSLQPEAITMTYWYAAEPDTPRHMSYSQAEHERNWAEIQAIVAQIDSCLAQDNWPLTDEWSHCRRCAYQVYCGRQEAGKVSQHLDDEPVEDEHDWLLEPNLP